MQGLVARRHFSPYMPSHCQMGNVEMNCGHGGCWATRRPWVPPQGKQGQLDLVIGQVFFYSQEGDVTL